MIRGRFRAQVAIKFYLAAFLFAGCAETTMTPAFRTTKGLSRPDRLLVFDFAVTPEEARVERRAGAALQSEEDVRIGKVLAGALSTNLVSELRSRGIEADRASDATVPGEKIGSIRGRFLRSDGSGSNAVGFALRDRQVRTLVQVFQGSGLKLQLVAEGETITPSGLKPGAAGEAAVDADAKRTAQVLADRIADYYRQEGWIK